MASARKRAHLLTSLLLLVGGPGCGVLDWPPGDGGGGTTGGEQVSPACFVQGGCNGVFVDIFNDNEEAADETGADGGEQNYWYDQMPALACEELGG